MKTLRAFIIGGLASGIIYIVLTALTGQLSAAPAPPPGPSIQSGTAVIETDTTGNGLTYIHFSFPSAPVMVVSLQSEIPANYVAGTTFSGNAGSIVVQLQEPGIETVYVKWIAVMATSDENTTNE